MNAPFADCASKPLASGRSRYSPPADVWEIELTDLIDRRGGMPLEPKQMQLLISMDTKAEKRVFYSGSIGNIEAPAVAIVGTRNVSAAGAARARKLARGLANAGVSVVSGLADGVDTEALSAAIAADGRVAAVIGTPIDRAYPAKNACLQQTIYEHHLLISQFESGSRTYRSNFPERNRLMAALTDATVVIEASDTSGTLHQSAECQRLGKWLFIAKSVADDASLTWPSRFRSYEKCVILEDVSDVLERVVSLSVSQSDTLYKRRSRRQ